MFPESQRLQKTRGSTGYAPAHESTQNYLRGLFEQFRGYPCKDFCLLFQNDHMQRASAMGTNHERLFDIGRL